MLKDRGLRGRCPTCANDFHNAGCTTLLAGKRSTVYCQRDDMVLSAWRHEAPGEAPVVPSPIGSTVVDLICESAIIELTSCTIGNCESRSKKKRS